MSLKYNLPMLHKEFIKVHNIVHSAYNHADMDAEAMAQLKDVVRAYDAALDLFHNTVLTPELRGE